MITWAQIVALRGPPLDIYNYISYGPSRFAFFPPSRRKKKTEGSLSLSCLLFDMLFCISTYLQSSGQEIL
jgi:hypothetical protein